MRLLSFTKYMKKDAVPRLSIVQAFRLSDFFYSITVIV